MITSTSTNFGVNPISFKCYDSAKIVVLQGMFTLDTASEEYLAAEQLEIIFPDQFSIPASKPTTAFLVCQKDDLQSGTIIKGQLQGNKLILEKLSIYDGKGTVQVILASGFVGETSEALLSPTPSGKITMSGKDYTFYVTIAQYANCIQNEWGMFFLQMSSWAYAPGVENEYGITGLPAGLSLDVPIFTSRTNSGLDGSECALAHIENGKITFNGKGKEGGSKDYLYRGFMKFFYVREPVIAPGNSETSE